MGRRCRIRFPEADPLPRSVYFSKRIYISSLLTQRRTAAYIGIHAALRRIGIYRSRDNDKTQKHPTTSPKHKKQTYLTHKKKKHTKIYLFSMILSGFLLVLYILFCVLYYYRYIVAIFVFGHSDPFLHIKNTSNIKKNIIFIIKYIFFQKNLFFSNFFFLSCKYGSI